VIYDWQQHSNADEQYPAIEIPDGPQGLGNGWPWWKSTLSLASTYYDLGFTGVDEDVYKRVDHNGLVLYVHAPSSGTDLLRLEAKYINHRIDSTYHTVRAQHHRKGVPIVARLLMQGADNTTIVLAMKEDEYGT
jgi:hypothetical protein